MNISSQTLPNNWSVSVNDYPVDLWAKFDPPPLPLGLLPKVIENFANVLSHHMGACDSGLAMAAITVMGAAIPDNIKLQVKKHDFGWLESARIWTALIGEPSSKKSPIINAAVKPLAKLDSGLVQKFQQEHAAWLALPKEERVNVQEPIQKRLRIEDTTVEAAQEVLKGSPDGVLCCQDELSGWFGAMEKYNGSGKGVSADRSFYLRSFNGGEYALNRIGRGVSLIPNISISLLGGIQPEPIRKIAADSVDDGLLQRLFPIVLRAGNVGLDQPMPPAQLEYDFTVMMVNNARLQAGNLGFDENAQILRQQLESKHLRLMNSEIVSKKFASHIGKWDGLFARLCIIWHVVENCNLASIPNLIRHETAIRVATFMDKFLLPHAVCFYAGVLGLSNDHDRLQNVASYILAHKLPTVTVRDVQRGDRAMRKITYADIRPILQQLVALNWLAETPGPYPSSEPSYLVNSLVHQLFAERAMREKNKRDEGRKVIAEIFQK